MIESKSSVSVHLYGQCKPRYSIFLFFKARDSLMESTEWLIPGHCEIWVKLFYCTVWIATKICGCYNHWWSFVYPWELNKVVQERENAQQLVPSLLPNFCLCSIQLRMRGWYQYTSGVYFLSRLSKALLYMYLVVHCRGRWRLNKLLEHNTNIYCCITAEKNTRL